MSDSEIVKDLNLVVKTFLDKHATFIEDNDHDLPLYKIADFGRYRSFVQMANYAYYVRVFVYDRKRKRYICIEDDPCEVKTIDELNVLLDKLSLSVQSQRKGTVLNLRLECQEP